MKTASGRPACRARCRRARAAAPSSHPTIATTKKRPAGEGLGEAEASPRRPGTAGSRRRRGRVRSGAEAYITSAPTAGRRAAPRGGRGSGAAGRRRGAGPSPVSPSMRTATLPASIGELRRGALEREEVGVGAGDEEHDARVRGELVASRGHADERVVPGLGARAGVQRGLAGPRGSSRAGRRGRSRRSRRGSRARRASRRPRRRSRSPRRCGRRRAGSRRSR